MGGMLATRASLFGRWRRLYIQWFHLPLPCQLLPAMSTVALNPAAAPGPVEVSSPTPRLRFPVVLTIAFWVVFIGMGLFDVEEFVRAMTRLGATALYLVLFLGWWLWRGWRATGDRVVTLALTAACIAAAVLLQHPSIRGLEIMAVMLAVPIMLTAWTGWLLVSGHAAQGKRRRGLILLAALAWIWTCFVRTDGFLGQGGFSMYPRWQPSGEEAFLAERSERSTSDDAEAAEPLVAAEGDWAEFRGPRRDGVVTGVTFATDWTLAPPKQLWKRRVGPGWSSLTVVGDRVFTQEQRGDQEAIVCFDAATGDEVWAHEDPARFEEAMGGPGPRATPTFADGRIYALGATGKLNCLDAATGKPVWSHDITKDGQNKTPYWGFCSSPLIAAGKVIVFAGGGAGNTEAEDDEEENADADDGGRPRANTLLAYDAETGELAWHAESGTHSYSSAQLATIDGVEQVLYLSDAALDAVELATGKPLWSLPTNAGESTPSLQPAVLGNDVLASFNPRAGLIRATVHRDGEKWSTEQQWTSKDIKPFFNDFVCHDGYAYGFDGDIFCCLDLETGKRRWKGGRYGSGQVVLAADVPALVVIGETGQLALVAANPAKHEELAKFQAIEGKTWNHPTLVGNRVFVRNAEEMACFELAPAKSDGE
jgi:outer membrane protein assembly factor BamB